MILSFLLREGGGGGAWGFRVMHFKVLDIQTFCSEYQV